MKKNIPGAILFFAILLFHLPSAHAQLGIVKRPKITVGANFLYAMPQGNFKDAYNFGIGGELFAGVGLGSTYLIGSIGTEGYQAQTNNSAGTLTTVPMKIGLKKYFLLKKIFVGADAGVATVKVNNASASAFTAGVGAGVRLLGLEAALYYNTFKNNVGYSKTDYSNTLQAKIGWSFSL